MIYKAVKYILENDSDFSTAIGTDDDSDVKIYPIHPRKEVALPFCVFNVLDARGNPTKDNPSTSGLDEYRVRVVIYDNDLDTCIDISEKARIALDGEKSGGSFNTVAVSSIDFESLNDTFVESYGDRGAIGIEMDFNIWSTP
jgi:hypothetical protein